MKISTMHIYEAETSSIALMNREKMECSFEEFATIDRLLSPFSLELSIVNVYSGTDNEYYSLRDSTPFDCFQHWVKVDVKSLL